MKTLLTFLVAMTASLAQVSLPSEDQRWEQSRKSWESVVQHWPERLPAHTKPEVAAKAIDAAEKARLAFLRGQRWLFCAQAAKLRHRAEDWALAAAGVQAPDPREALADLDDRIAAIRQELDRLTPSASPGKPSDATLVYIAKLQRQLEELTRLRSLLSESARQFVTAAGDIETARQTARSLAGSFDRASALFQELVRDSVLEEERWRHHHNLLRQAFTLPPAGAPPNAPPPAAGDWRSACAAVRLP